MARIGVSGAQEDALRLRHLLEKLELALAASADDDSTHGRGLGSNKLLFMACELLLLAAESDGFPLLLSRSRRGDPPQRQLRLMSFLQDQVKKVRPDGHSQIVVTTHSPNLASDLRLDNLVPIQRGRAFPPCEGRTQLSKADYRFLERFLDVLKGQPVLRARGARGGGRRRKYPDTSVLIASAARPNFDHHGVSVVNVGGVGLGSYARIFMREDPAKDGIVNIAVAVHQWTWT